MHTDPFETISPPEAGIPPGAVADLLAYLKDKKLPLHGLVLLRHGRIAAEAYWKPFDRDYKHRAYSSSKSFAAVAIGILAGEGRIALDDRVIDYFPEYNDGSVHPYIAQTTVRDLLSMRTAYTTGSYFPYDDWTEAFFRLEVNHLPGTVFRYDTMASVMLGLLVRRITGEEVTAYLRPRLFEPAGMSPDIWCIQTPCGHDWVGSGIMCTTRDLARFGQVCMQDGRYEGKQLIPADFIRAATGRVSDNTVASSMTETSFGYGYQFWRTRHGFATRGMGSQLAICVPEHDLVLATTGDTQSLTGGDADIYQALWNLLPSLSDGPLPQDAQGQAALDAATENLSLAPVEGMADSKTARRIAGRTFVLDDNPMGMRSVRFSFGPGEGEWTYVNATGEHTLRFGLGRQARQPFPQTHYYGKTMKQPLGRGYDSHTSAAWVDEDTLLLCCYATDWYLGTFKMSFAFKGDTITLQGAKYAELFFDEYQGYASGRMDPAGA